MRWLRGSALMIFETIEECVGRCLGVDRRYGMTSCFPEIEYHETLPAIGGSGPGRVLFSPWRSLSRHNSRCQGSKRSIRRLGRNLQFACRYCCLDMPILPQNRSDRHRLRSTRSCRYMSRDPGEERGRSHRRPYTLMCQRRKLWFRPRSRQLPYMRFRRRALAIQPGRLFRRPAVTRRPWRAPLCKSSRIRGSASFLL
jgi:hypothetical protein